MRHEELIKNQKRQAKWNDDLLRRKRAQTEIDYYNNCQESYMQAFYEKTFEDQKKVTLLKNHSQIFNLTEQIIDQLAVAFKNGVDVELYKPSEEKQSEQTKKREDDLKEILKNCMFEANLKMADKLAILNHYSAISVVWDTESNSIRLDLIPASICFVTQKENSPREIDAFHYQINITENSPQLADNVTLWQRWTRDTSDIVSIGSNGSVVVHQTEPNPYGRIPIVAFSPEIPLFGYFSEKRNMLVEWNTTINKELTDYEITHTIQCHSILALIDSDIAKSLTVGQNSFIEIKTTRDGSKADAKYLNPGTDLEKLLKTINMKSEFYANSMGISATVYNNSQSDFSSGYQLKLSMSGVIDKVNERLPFYQKATQDLVKLIAKIYSYNSQDTFDNYEIYTKIKPLKIEMSEGEKIDTYLKKITLGTTSPVEILMQEEKISREEAEQRIAQINIDNNLGQVQTPPVDILGN
jgi:hypothetical protein